MFLPRAHVHEPGLAACALLVDVRQLEVTAACLCCAAQVQAPQVGHRRQLENRTGVGGQDTEQRAQGSNLEPHEPSAEPQASPARVILLCILLCFLRHAQQHEQRSIAGGL